jgi:hypothetical protein
MKGTAERSVVNEGISTGNNQGRTRNSKPTSANNKKALRHLCCGVQTVRHPPHRPNGRILITSQQGYQDIMVGIHLDANYISCKLTTN